MKQLQILLLCIYLVGCGQSDQGNETTTELEGTWEGICVTAFTNFNNTPSESHKIITIYNQNNVYYSVNTYSDTNCAQLESTVDASLSNLFASPQDIPTRFEIGNATTGSNGETVKEIDFYTENDAIQKNIYLLINNSTTLYFGIPCSLSQNSCVNDRPTELSYINEYTKT